jgi:N6-adenosine-specific RNA methylase IME4
MNAVAPMRVHPFSEFDGKRYSVILADPPWKFKTRTKAGEGKSPQRHYPCMSFDDICAMPVADLADRHCTLFLWCTWPTIFKAERVIQSWGFTYSGLAWEWIKYNARTGKFAFAGGYGSRKNLEPCLLARRGNPRRFSKSERDFMFDLRREHSRKPDEQYERIDRMYRGPRIELFARARHEDWDAWGNEVGKFA